MQKEENRIFEKQSEQKRKKDERKEEEQDKRSRTEVQQGGASSSTDMSVDPVGPVLVTSPGGKDKIAIDEVTGSAGTASPVLICDSPRKSF